MLSFRNMIYNQDTWKVIKTWNTASRYKHGTNCKWWVYRLIHCYQYTLQRLEALNLVEKKMATMAVPLPKQNCHWIWEMTSDKSTLLFHQLNFSLLLQKVYLWTRNLSHFEQFCKLHSFNLFSIFKPTTDL